MHSATRVWGRRPGGRHARMKGAPRRTPRAYEEHGLWREDLLPEASVHPGDEVVLGGAAARDGQHLTIQGRCSGGHAAATEPVA